MAFLIAGVLTGLLVLTGCAQTGGLAEVDRQVVRILAQTAGADGDVLAGSGFVVASGYVVTNQHVVADAVRVLVIAGGAVIDAHPGEVLWSSVDHDLAILAVPALARRGLPLGLADLSRAKGERVLAIGFPGIADAAFFLALSDPVRDHERLARLVGESTVSSGVIGRVVQRAWLGGAVDITVIQHDATLHAGNSGGPLLNTCGQVIGVNTERAVPVLDEARGVIHPGEGIAFAAHAVELAAILDGLRLPYRATHRACSETGARFIGVAWLILAGLLGLAALRFLRNRQAAWTRSGAARSASSGGLRSDYFDPAPAALPDRSGRAHWQMNWQGPEMQGILPLPEALLDSLEGCVIGRSSEVAELVVDQETVSRRHCAVRQQQGELTLMDLNSSNGTRLAGIQLKPFVWYPLQSDQSVQMGGVLWTVRRPAHR